MLNMQKPFAFRLSALTFIIVICLAACKYRGNGGRIRFQAKSNWLPIHYIILSLVVTRFLWLSNLSAR